MNNRKEQLKQIRQYISGPIDREIVSITPTKALTEFLSHYPRLEYWRLLVDGFLYAKEPAANEQFRWYSRDNQGWHDYEKREPGSITAFLSAWQYCLSCLGHQTTYTPLTKEFIISLHKKVSKEVKLANLKMNTIRGGNISISFSFTKTILPRYTKKGIKNLLNTIRAPSSTASILLSTDLIKKNDNKTTRFIDNDLFISNKLSQEQDIPSLIWSEIKKDYVTYYPPAEAKDHLEKKFDEIILNYNNQIMAADDDNRKIIIIGETIQAFERLHPFTDFNGRTFVNLLLNYLLLQEGFPPATLFEPNVFDAYDDGTGNALLNIIKKGIENTRQIYEGKFDLFGTKLLEDNHQKNKFQHMFIRATVRHCYSQLKDCQTACIDNQKIINEIKEAISSLLQDNKFCFIYIYTKWSACQKVI